MRNWKGGLPLGIGVMLAILQNTVKLSAAIRPRKILDNLGAKTKGLCVPKLP